MQELMSVGDQPVPGYTLRANLGGTPFMRMWKVDGPDGKPRVWKEIDLVVGNAAVETRTLELLVTLRHPKLNTLNNFWNLNDGQSLIIETDVPVMSLADRLNECVAKGLPGIPAEELQQYFLDAAEGLDFLNMPQHLFKGEKVAIYHRALKPECFLLFDTIGGRHCRISDFGLAKPVTEGEAAHSQGLSHFDYDPPEFFEGITARNSDQYSLAINYYYLRTKKMPFTGTMLQQLQGRISNNPDLSAIGDQERAVLKVAMQKDPDKRFESCTAFIAALASGATPVMAAPPTAAPAAANQPAQRPTATPVAEVPAKPKSEPMTRVPPSFVPPTPVRSMASMSSQGDRGTAAASTAKPSAGAGRSSPASILSASPSSAERASTPLVPPPLEPRPDSEPVVFRNQPEGDRPSGSGYSGERAALRGAPPDNVQQIRKKLAAQQPQRAEVPDEYFAPDEEKKIPVVMAVGIIVVVAVLVVLVFSQF